MTSRLIDRPLRPLFPEGWRNETQIVAMVLSADSENDPDVIARDRGFGGALYIPNIAVRQAHRRGARRAAGRPIGGESHRGRTENELAEHRDRRHRGSDRDGGSRSAGSFRRRRWRKRWRSATSKCAGSSPRFSELHAKVNPTKVLVTPPAFDEALYKQIEKQFGEQLHDALDTAKHPKKESYGLVDAVNKAKFSRPFRKKTKIAASWPNRAFERLRERIFRDDILDRQRRPDGRAFDQIRQITCEVGVLPRVHGSALFTRGETQALATLTLGTKEDMQRLDLLFEQDRSSASCCTTTFRRSASAK